MEEAGEEGREKKGQGDADEGVGGVVGDWGEGAEREAGIEAWESTAAVCSDAVEGGGQDAAQLTEGDGVEGDLAVGDLAEGDLAEGDLAGARDGAEFRRTQIGETGEAAAAICCRQFRTAVSGEVDGAVGE